MGRNPVTVGRSVTRAGAEPTQATSTQDIARTMPYYYGATGASEDGLHRWQPHTRRRLVRGNGRGAGLARVMLQEMRWRKPPRHVALRIVAVVLTFVLHVVIFMLMSLSRTPLPAPGEAADVATIKVRLIDQPKPPPPPPPIKMPVPKVGPAAQPKPHSARHAPTPATPPAPAPAKPIQPHASQSPPAETSPDIATPPPRVVEEISRQATPAPELDAIQIVPVEQPTSRLRPIPSQQQALTVSVGKTELRVDAPAPSQPQALGPAEVTASAPEVPSMRIAPTRQRVTPVTRQAPSIATQIQTTPVSEPVVAQPTPLPQVPTATATPDLNLPIADVPVAQAPQVQAPAVQLEQPSIAVASPTQTASAASAPKPQASSARAADTWAPANDQFQSVPNVSKRTGAQRTGVGHPSESQGQVQVPPQGNSDVMSRNSDRLGYKSTIFDQYWAPANETILDTFLRHMIERLTVKHTFHVAPGVRVHCFIGPLAIFAGCAGDPPRKASSKSHDSRLNMAPARSLVPGMDTSAPARPTSAPAVQLNNTAKCTTARVAGAPLPPGCPGAPAKSSSSDRWDLSGNGT